MRRFALLLTFAVQSHAETHALTLKQAVEKALAQNPEVLMAHLDELKLAQGVHVARDPFTTHVGAGSGLAYSNGFPLSIDGSAPAVFQAKASRSLYNRPQSYAVAQAKETARGAAFSVDEKRNEITFQVASLFIDVDRAGRLAEAARKQLESLDKVLQTARARVEEGRDLAVSAQEANVNLLKARQRLLVLESDREYSERNLAATLGYEQGDLVQPVEEERTPPRIPETEQAALQTAFNSSNELKRLESSYSAKGLEIQGNRAQRLPRIDLVAQYALLARFSNYDQYFSKFQRNNAQLGASIQIPLLTGAGVHALSEQAESDQQHIRTEMQTARNRIALDLHRSYQDIEKAELSGQLAQAELDLARAQLSIVLAQMGEGRAALRQVEEARFNENEKWIAFYDARFNAERARLAVLRQTGELRAALQ